LKAPASTEMRKSVLLPESPIIFPQGLSRYPRTESTTKEQLKKAAHEAREPLPD
jgi:hypothetical protein